ncbi:MAG TPA: kelch repeat-containing protein, partial [Polyangiaceae bacterium]
DGRVILFGGEGDEGLLGDTWTLPPGSFAWSPGPAFAPAARTDASLVAIDTGCFLFGGLTSAGPQSDVWKTDAYGNWSMQSAYGPAARSAHALAYDPARRVVVLFGGLGASGPLGDTWEWSFATNAWAARTPATSPPARFGHRLIFDPARSVTVLAGGEGAAPGSAFSDTWEYSGATGQWTLREPAAALPARGGAAAFFDPAAAAPVVFGGLAHRSLAAALSYGDTWTFARGGSADADPPRYPIAAHCNAGSDCATGQCVDGLCCESACAGQCAACNAPGSEGHCVAVSGAPVGSRAPCAAIAACSLTCDGSDPSSCHSQAGNACATGTCASGVSLEVSRCDGSGVCVPGRRHACAPLACNGASCGCSVDADCGDASYFCGDGACRPFARLTSFTLTAPVSSGWGSSVTATAAASGTIDPVFWFSYAEPQPGSPSYGAACGGAATCVLSLPPGNGQWVVTVQVKDRASPNGFDDARQLSVSP